MPHFLHAPIYVCLPSWVDGHLVRLSNSPGVESRSYIHSKKVLLLGFHFRRTTPFLRISETFRKREIGTHSNADPMTRPTRERTPASAKAPPASISDVIATVLLGPGMANRSWQ